MKLRIGIDVDGCLYPWSQAVNEALVEKFGIEDPGEHLHWDYLQERITREQWDWIWSADAVRAVFGRFDLIYPGAKKAVRALCQEHEVHFVTHRHPRRTAEITGRWLNFFFRNYTGVHVLHNRCRKYELARWDAFIDDKPQTFMEFAELTDALVLVPSRPWNHVLFAHDYRITPFTDWSDVPGIVADHTNQEVPA